MNPTKSKLSSGKLAAVAAIAVILVVGACASGNILKWNQVDAAAMMKSEAGKQVSTPSGSRRTVQMRSSFSVTSSTRTGSRLTPGEGFLMARLGKKTLAESDGRLQQCRRKRICTRRKQSDRAGSSPGGCRCRLHGSRHQYGREIWDITKGDGPPVLRLVYRDSGQRMAEKRHMRRNIRMQRGCVKRCSSKGRGKLSEEGTATAKSPSARQQAGGFPFSLPG